MKSTGARSWNELQKLDYMTSWVPSIVTPAKNTKSWWRHQMETFSALLVLCAGNSPVPVNSPHKGQWRGSLMFSLICARINDWVNNREAGDLRRHRGHYDVIVMVICPHALRSIPAWISNYISYKVWYHPTISNFITFLSAWSLIHVGLQVNSCQ